MSSSLPGSYRCIRLELIEQELMRCGGRAVMAKNNRADKRKSDWHDQVSGKTCGTCGGSGSKVDDKGKHIGACSTCRGWGKV
jgi:hypothetical protein